MENKIKVLLTTFSKKHDAYKVGERLVKFNLSPCVQLIPKIESIYKWKGKMQKEQEVLLLIKCDINKESELISFLREQHPHEVPEIISTNYEIKNLDYSHWFFLEK
ncbi:MAG: divalent-cation tolerance protein CutA [Candidatus Marinimicrobia bacterium]|nr:divalent-cation tolerance protein CutA [Candidatus Neomarinimicrobiota bacterium]|tara:strand:+ start:2208 stop:2525 length:318 start_codon:yes stop_codon:yes gene_type:complete